MKPISKILIIAGSDSSGGAGIQADIKTVTALGSYAMTAITAITSQNTTGVNSVFPVNPSEIKNQIIFTCKDLKPNHPKWLPGSNYCGNPPHNFYIQMGLLYEQYNYKKMNILFF